MSNSVWARLWDWWHGTTPPEPKPTTFICKGCGSGPWDNAWKCLGLCPNCSGAD
jgi:hypothetical protein